MNLKMIILALFFGVMAGCEQHITTTASGGSSDQAQEAENPIEAAK